MNQNRPKLTFEAMQRLQQIESKGFADAAELHALMDIAPDHFDMDRLIPAAKSGRATAEDVLDMLLPTE